MMKVMMYNRHFSKRQPEAAKREAARKDSRQKEISSMMKVKM